MQCLVRGEGERGRGRQTGRGGEDGGSPPGRAWGGGGLVARGGRRVLPVLLSCRCWCWRGGAWRTEEGANEGGAWFDRNSHWRAGMVAQGTIFTTPTIIWLTAAAGKA